MHVVGFIVLGCFLLWCACEVVDNWHHGREEDD